MIMRCWTPNRHISTKCETRNHKWCKGRIKVENNNPINYGVCICKCHKS